MKIQPYVRQSVSLSEWDPTVLAAVASLQAEFQSTWSDVVIEHIGSTSVPGLPGKNTIDLMALTHESRSAEVTTTLEELGFVRARGFRDDRPAAGVWDSEH